MFYFLAFVAGCVVMGLVANRKPEWFARVVKAANAVDDQVNKNLSAMQAKKP